MIYFKKLVISALDNHASYLYLTPNNPPALRKCGQIEFLKIAALSSIEIEEIIQNIVTSDQYAVYKNQGYCSIFMDFSDDYILQIYMLLQEYNSEVAIQILERKSHSMLDAEILNRLDHLISSNRGLLLITGPSYNGRMITYTSIIDSIVDRINLLHKKHVLIFEHKKSFSRVKADNSLIRSYNLTQASFPFIKSQGADIVIFNDFYDISLINTAINCIETGHLVVGIIDSVSLEYAVERITRLFPTRELGLKFMSLYLTSVIMQVLVKKNNSFDDIYVRDFISVNEDIRSLIKNDNVSQIDTQILSKLTNLIEQGIIDYDSSKSIVGQFSGYSDIYTYDHNYNVF